MADVPARRTLVDVVASLDPLDPAARRRTIFAEQPWWSGSLAVVLADTPLRGRAPTMPTYAYLLDVDRAAEVLEVWSRRHAGTVPSPEQAADALIHYAAHETHQPTVCEHRGCGRPEAGTCATCGRSVCTVHAQRDRPEVACAPCSDAAAAAVGWPKVLAKAVGRTFGPWSLVLVLGALCIVLGVLIQSMPVGAGGACVAVVAGCVWLERLVLQLME